VHRGDAKDAEMLWLVSPRALCLGGVSQVTPKLGILRSRTGQVCRERGKKRPDSAAIAKKVTLLSQQIGLP